LYDDGAGNPSAVTRDYVFDLEASAGAPLLNVFGGKITTFRKLSEHALQRLGRFLPQMKGDWTAKATLPGGDIPKADFVAFLETVQGEYPWLPRDLAMHWARLYGTRMRMFLGDAKSLDGLGRRFGARLYEAEVQYLCAREWARSAEDVLFRRTKENLHMTKAEITAFTAWFDGALARSA
jgi:glycerol-3-phosphate dehydrogenase